MTLSRSRLELSAQVSGLFATGWIIWTTSVAPYAKRARLGAKIVSSLEIAICALLWSAAIALALRVMMPSESRDETSWLLPRVSAVAVWFAPATILFMQFSPTGIAAGLALVIVATRFLSKPWLNPFPAASPQPFVQTDSSPRNFHQTLIISTVFQIGTLSFALGHPAPASALLVMAAAMFTSLAIGVGAWVQDRPPHLPRPALGLALTAMLGLTVGYVAGRSGWWGFGWGSGWGFAFQTGPAIDDGGNVASDSSRQIADRVETSSDNVPGDYPGVILWPEIKPVTTLVAPLTRGRFGFGSAPRPLTIPFGGEYWMFRWPYSRPPKNSFFKRGAPTVVFFRTTDNRPLQMEAHHKLEGPLRMSCCRSVEVVILNADKNSASIALQTVLIDSRTVNKRQSLGVATVFSVPDLNVEKPMPVTETLTFAFPTSPRIEQFDEIEVDFHRTGNRRDKSARVAIDRFVLRP
jgi:hypothetical protein